MDIEDYYKKSPHFFSLDLPDILKECFLKNKIESILDCGSGDGNILNAMSYFGLLNNRKVFAIDLSENRVKIIKKFVKSVDAFVDNAEKLEKIKDNSIDFVFSTQVIEHVDHEKMLKSINRVLKEDGTVYISTVFKKWYGWYFYRNNGKWVIDPTHVREYDKDNQLTDVVKFNNFKIIKSVKKQTFFPIVDFFIKRMGIRDRMFLCNEFFRTVRKIKIPIPGYFHWELVLKKIVNKPHEN